MLCNCDEMYIDGEPITIPEYEHARHDCQFVRRRNQLVPIAELHAMMMADKEKGGAESDEGKIVFNTEFAAKMNELWAANNKI